MLKSVLAAGALGLVQLSTAQITVGNEWFVTPGFRVTQAVDTAYVDVDNALGLSGTNFIWEFDDVEANDSLRITALAGSTDPEAVSFGDADLVLTFAGRNDVDPTFAIFDPGAEVFLRRSDNELNVIGVLNSDASGLTPPSRFGTPLTFQAAPLTYESSGADSTSESFFLDPQLLATALNLPTLATADSIELTISQLVEYEVDGWGELELGGQTYPALRQSRFTRTEQSARIQLGGNWVDLARLVDPERLEGIDLSPRRFANFAWIVPGEVYPILQVTRNLETGSLSIAQTTSTTAGTSSRPVALHPDLELRANRSAGVATISLGGTPSVPLRSPRIVVYGTDGRVLHRQNLDSQTGQWRLDASGWAAGVQMVSLWEGGLLVKTVVF